MSWNPCGILHSCESDDLTHCAPRVFNIKTYSFYVFVFVLILSLACLVFWKSEKFHVELFHFCLSYLQKLGGAVRVSQNLCIALTSGYSISEFRKLGIFSLQHSIALIFSIYTCPVFLVYLLNAISIVLCKERAIMLRELDFQYFLYVVYLIGRMKMRARDRDSMLPQVPSSVANISQGPRAHSSSLMWVVETQAFEPFYLSLLIS